MYKIDRDIYSFLYSTGGVGEDGTSLGDEAAQKFNFTLTAGDDLVRNLDLQLRQLGQPGYIYLHFRYVQRIVELYPVQLDALPPRLISIF